MEAGWEGLDVVKARRAGRVADNFKKGGVVPSLLNMSPLRIA